MLYNLIHKRYIECVTQHMPPSMMSFSVTAAEIYGSKVVSWQLPCWAIFVYTVIANHYIILRPLPATDALVWTQNHSQDLFSSTTVSHCLQNNCFYSFCFFLRFIFLKIYYFGQQSIILCHFVCLFNQLLYLIALLHPFDYTLRNGESYKEYLSVMNWECLSMKLPYLLPCASPVTCRVLEGFHLSSSNTKQPSPPMAQWTNWPRRSVFYGRLNKLCCFYFQSIKCIFKTLNFWHNIL